MSRIHMPMNARDQLAVEFRSLRPGSVAETLPFLNPARHARLWQHARDNDSAAEAVWRLVFHATLARTHGVSRG